jgi:dTDP-4-dehydrorhamnose 3,5-epimerase
VIEGVEIKRLTKHADERGFLMELLRSDDPIFSKFGQAYVSMNYPCVVRAWHWHRKQDDHFVVVKGMVKVALRPPRGLAYPRRGGRILPGREQQPAAEDPCRRRARYKTVGTEPSLLINFHGPTMPRSRTSTVCPGTRRRSYDWQIKMG